MAVATNWRPTPFLALAIVLNLGYWVIGQGLGGIFYTGSATDPNAAPLFVLLALVLYTLTPIGRRTPSRSGVARTGVRVGALSVARQRPGIAPRPVALLAPLLAIVAVALVAAALADSPQPATSTGQPVAYDSPFDGLAISPPVPAPPTSLRNYVGDQVNLRQYGAEGKAVLLTFVSTRCPTICPQITSVLHQTLAAMPPSERGRLQVIAVSIDPQGDTPTSVAAFLRRYGMVGRLQYLIGSRSQLGPILRQWGMPQRSGALDLSTAVVYGISVSGEVMSKYSAYFTPQEIIHDVRQLEAV